MPVKLLLADKSITIQKVVEMLFSGREYEVVSASDGETALSEAARVVPDVVLADVDLPRVDGYSLSARLKQNPALAQVPVILMMSRDDVYDGVKGKQAGILDSIAKPFESQELIGKVKKALAAAGPRSAEPAAPAAPPKPAAPPAPPKPAAPPAPPKPVAPPAPPKPAAPKPKAPPQDIFDIISEAPSQADLKAEAAPDEEEVLFEVEPDVEEIGEQPAGEEALFEVEPDVEEVGQPLVREETKVLPVGAKAVEEMRAGLGLTEWEEEPQPEIVTFESLEKTLAIEKPAKAGKSEPAPPPPAKKSEPAPPPAAVRAPRPADLPPMPTASDMWSIAEQTVARMAKDVFDQMPQVKPPQVSDDKLRALVEEAVARMAKDAFAKAAPPAPQALPEAEQRKLAEATYSRIAQDTFKNMAPPVPKVSEETVRRGIADAVSAIAREVARDVIEKVAWEVVPRLAEAMIKEEIERLKAEP